MMKKVLFVCLAMALMIAPAVMLAAPASANGAINIAVDIKPGSDSNPLNVNSKGVLPVAILGTEDFDVMAVNASTVVLTWRGISLPPPVGGVPPDDGVPPLRCAYEDVNRDGFMDIVLKYSMKAAGPLTITREASGPLDIMFKGELLDGTPIVGYDTVRVINKLMDRSK